MSRPFALIGFVYLAVQAVSIYFGSGFAFLTSGCFFLLFFLSLFATKLRTAKVVPIACMVAAVALSAYAGYHVWKIEPLAELAEKDASITGTLCELPYENNGKFYYTLRVDEIEIEGMEHPHNPGKIIMTTRNALDIEPYGSISGKVHLYQSFGSEDGFSIRQYDYSKRIHMRAYLYEYEGYSVSPTAEKPPYYYALSIRKTMMNSLDRLLPKEEAGIMKAVLLGDKTGLTDEIKSDFNAAGTYHLLVVSGLHMTIVFQGLLKLLKFCKIPHKLSCVITAFGVLSFMAITGFSPSALRSGIMSLLFLAAMMFHRKADSLNSLGISVFLLCAVNPYAAADFGFLLSVTSALSLILLSKPIRKFFLDRTKRVKHGKAFLYSIFSSVSSSLAVTAGTLPLVIIAFVTFSVISFISNLLMILPTTIMLPITALAALFESVPSLSLLAKPFALVGGLIAKYLIFVAHWIAKIPFSLISSDYEFIMLWLAMTMLLFAFAIFLAKRKILLRTVLTLSSILLIAGIFSYQLANCSTARVSILDVEDGISVVVTANRQTAIIGCNAYSDYTTYQYLKGHGIHNIDYLQPLSDETIEYQNLAKLNEKFQTKNFILPNGQYFAGDLEKSLEEVEKISYYEKSAKTILNDDVTIELHSDAKGNYTVLMVKEIRILILSSEYDLTNIDLDLNDIDILITDTVPQHAEYLQSFITVLSMEEQSMADSVKKMDMGNVQLYATAGRGNFHIDIENGRNITLRRGSGG